MNDLEKKISKYHNRKYCILVGNGTTAIYLVLLAQGFKNKQIAIPNNTCMNVVLPIYFSNNIPIFIDIEKETLGIDISKVKQKIDGLIAVHAYGNICNIEKISKICKEKNIFLLEDLAVAQGLSKNEKILGSFGDASILSFGSGKNIDIGHGGAVLTDNEYLFKNVKQYLEVLPYCSESKEKKLDKISKYHTKIYNIDCGKSLNKYSYDFKKICLENRHNFLYKFDNKFAQALDKGIDNLERNILIRQKNALYLEQKLNNIRGVEVVISKYGSSYWRFNIFVTNYRDELFEFLLNKKYKVSSWYHSLDLLFEKREEVRFPISEWVSENIINIWVNEDIDKRYLDSILVDIVNFLKEKYEK